MATPIKGAGHTGNVASVSLASVDSPKSGNFRGHIVSKSDTKKPTFSASGLFAGKRDGVDLNKRAVKQL
ncbi:hypothetical protein ACUSIJ_22410 [Pseudochelatococcus sp. B33]